MSLRPVFLAIGVALLVGAIALPACGNNDEPPAAREFEEDKPSPTPPPKEVHTQLQMKYRNKAFVVSLDAAEDYCEGTRTVEIVQDLKRDKKIASIPTDEEGDGAKKQRRVKGKFYAKVPSEPSAEYGNLSICKGDRSQTVIVRD